MPSKKNMTTAKFFKFKFDIMVFSSDGEGPIPDHNAWVEEIEEKPEINEFGHITSPIVSQPQSHRIPHQSESHHGHHHVAQNGHSSQNGHAAHQVTQPVQVQSSPSISHQAHSSQSQNQNSQFSASWYPSYIYSPNIQPISNSRESFPNSLITYSENNNVVGIS